MTHELIELTEDEFDQRYPLIPNHMNPNASWAFGDCGGGCLFETYGDEFEFVRRFDPNRVWTILDGDGGDLYVVSGLHFVNRVGYLLSRNAVPSDVVIEVRIPMESGDGEDES